MASSFSDQLKRLEKEMGYKGCKNCLHQIAPLRMCKWAEQGGDGRIHLICPMWDKRGGEERVASLMNMNLIGVKQIGIVKTALIGWKMRR